MIRQRPIGHMPFAGHRTQAEVREEEERKELIKSLEREMRDGRKIIERERRESEREERRYARRFG